MAQLFGQSEAPMMISTLAPAEHRSADGSIDETRLASAGFPAPLVAVAILDDDGTGVAFGTPGGDQQDQWTVPFLLRHLVGGLDLQAAIDAVTERYDQDQAQPVADLGQRHHETDGTG